MFRVDFYRNLNNCISRLIRPSVLNWQAEGCLMDCLIIETHEILGTFLYRVENGKTYYSHLNDNLNIKIHIRAYVNRTE